MALSWSSRLMPRYLMVTLVSSWPRLALIVSSFTPAFHSIRPAQCAVGEIELPSIQKFNSLSQPGQYLVCSTFLITDQSCAFSDESGKLLARLCSRHSHNASWLSSMKQEDISDHFARIEGDFSN